MNEEQQKIKKPLNPEKMKNDIKWTGLVGIILGILSIAISITAYVYFSIKIDISIIYIYISIVLGLLLIIPGIFIRKNPEKSRNWMYFLLIFSIILGISAYSKGKQIGFLLIFGSR